MAQRRVQAGERIDEGVLARGHLTQTANGQRLGTGGTQGVLVGGRAHVS